MSEDKDKNKTDDIVLDSQEGEEPVRKLELKDSLKYSSMVSETLESFGSESEESGLNLALKKAQEVEPFSLKRVRIFGSTWFALLILFYVANLLYSFYLDASAVPAMMGVEAERERREVFANLEDDFTPFRSFLALSSAVSDGDYSSFIRAVRDLNTYFPSQVFDNSALFSETRFSFHTGGLSYIDPE